MSWIKNFNSYRRDYLLKEDANQQVATGPTWAIFLDKLANKVPNAFKFAGGIRQIYITPDSGGGEMKGFNKSFQITLENGFPNDPTKCSWKKIGREKKSFKNVPGFPTPDNSENEIWMYLDQKIDNFFENPPGLLNQNNKEGWFVCTLYNFLRWRIYRASYDAGTFEKDIVEALKYITDQKHYRNLEANFQKYGCNGFKTIKDLLNDEFGGDEEDQGYLEQIANNFKKANITMDYGVYADPVSSIQLNSGGTTDAASTNNASSTNTSNTGGTNTGGASSNTTQIKCAKYRDPNRVEENVKLLQQKLKDLKFYEGEVDGKYGDTTLEAVKKFQIEHKISPAVGCYGPKTAEKMKEVSKDYIPYKRDTKPAEKGTSTPGFKNLFDEFEKDEFKAKFELIEVEQSGQKYYSCFIYYENSFHEVCFFSRWENQPTFSVKMYGLNDEGKFDTFRQELVLHEWKSNKELKPSPSGEKFLIKDDESIIGRDDSNLLSMKFDIGFYIIYAFKEIEDEIPTDTDSTSDVTQKQEEDNSIMPEKYWKNTTTGETPSSNEPKQA